MKDKKVVVTGGLGFIGSHLVEALVEDNDVIIIDNRLTGTLENLRDFADARLEVIEGDVAAINLKKIFDGCDYVFHQAALPSVQRSINEPLGANESNVTGTLKVLIAAKESAVKKVVFASSSSVYGDTIELPKREDMSLHRYHRMRLQRRPESCIATCFKKCTACAPFPCATSTCSVRGKILIRTTRR
jgi:UDP-glucose 4-epimerase